MTQNQLDQITKEIAQLEAQRLELQGEQNAARTAIKDKEASLGQAILSRKPIEASVSFISAERVRVDGLMDADRQLDARIAELRTQRAEVKYQMAIAQYDASIAETREKLLAAFALLYDVVDVAASARVVYPPRDFTPSKESREVFNMRGQLAEIDLYRKVLELERIAPAFMKEAKERRSARQ
jgi:hypothetical protein